MLARLWSKGELDTLLVVMQKWCSSYGRVQKFLKIFKIEMSYDAATPLPGIDPEELQSGSGRDTCVLASVTALFKIRKEMASDG